MKRDIKSAIDAFAEHGRPTGGFLQAVLTNNLSGAIALADDQNLQDLLEIVRYCYWEIPGCCWGSEAQYNNWIIKKKKERHGEEECHGSTIST